METKSETPTETSAESKPISEFDKKMLIYVIERHYDLAYLKLTVIIILLIIIIFYITCKTKVTSELFTPSASILVNDIYNSTAGFDGRDSI
jgi:uncharacterized integral membrane protein